MSDLFDSYVREAVRSDRDVRLVEYDGRGGDMLLEIDGIRIEELPLIADVYSFDLEEVGDLSTESRELLDELEAERVARSRARRRARVAERTGAHRSAEGIAFSEGSA
ncbi:hypothetical protein GCM10009037_07210 [Halarchaeum grantii]|uniref:Uncharacterized protein n=1 Tax=Halarchaeum grantii TaxID=1193105 RepID=A0A830F799_9EURY|nr:hypothetical protein [Halarchaeum grantii]GGL26150.1 hypothetical protein GCM10009037_07210 [Halarchaeum grantii]